MTMKSQAVLITPVLFRTWKGKEGGGKEGGDVIALFPTLPADRYGTLVESFMHVGQHGGASLQGVIAQTRPANHLEYRSLKHELESAPYHYKLQVYERSTSGMHKQLMAELKFQSGAPGLRSGGGAKTRRASRR